MHSALFKVTPAGAQRGQQGQGVRGAMVLEDALEHRVGGRFVGIREGVCGCVHRDLSVAAAWAYPGSSRWRRCAPAGVTVNNAMWMRRGVREDRTVVSHMLLALHGFPGRGMS